MPGVVLVKIAISSPGITSAFALLMPQGSQVPPTLEQPEESEPVPKITPPMSTVTLSTVRAFADGLASMIAPASHELESPRKLATPGLPSQGDGKLAGAGEWKLSAYATETFTACGSPAAKAMPHAANNPSVRSG